jgi:hypothetical protein
MRDELGFGFVAAQPLDDTVVRDGSPTTTRILRLRKRQVNESHGIGRVSGGRLSKNPQKQISSSENSSVIALTTMSRWAVAEPVLLLAD